MSSPAQQFSPWSRRALYVVIVWSLLAGGILTASIAWPGVLVGSYISAHIVPLTAATFCLTAITALVGLRSQRATSNEHAEAYHALANELSEVANKSEIVINAIGDGVIAIDGKGIVQLINPAAQAIIGWGKQDAQNLDYRSIFKLYSDKDEPLSDDAGPVQQVLHGNASITRNDLTLVTGSGKKINISLLVSPVGSAGNGAIIVFRDITNDVAENKQRAEFISTASHEMRTPVAAIEGYLGLALNPATAEIDDKARVYLTKAHESAEHLGRLFQDLLDVSKAEDGRLKNNPQVIELVDFVRESAAILAPKATEKGLSLIFKPDFNEESINSIAPVFYVEADPDHLREIMANLIENAIKYTKEGTITVNVTSTEEHAVISVADTGIGIAREDIPHLFQKFYRVDNTDTREIGGTGLGLYLCRRLVEAMDGRLRVESTPGKGSTFFVEIDRLSMEEVDRLKHQMDVAST